MVYFQKLGSHINRFILIFRLRNGNRLFTIVVFVLLATAFESVAYLIVPSLFEVLNTGTLGSFNLITDKLMLIGFSPTISSIVFLVFLAFLLKGLFMFVAGYFTVTYIHNYTRDLRNSLSQKVRDLNYSDFSKMNSNVIISNLVDQAQKSGDFVKFNIQLIVQLSFLVTYVLLLCYISIPITLIFTFSSALIFYLFKRIRLDTNQQSKIHASVTTDYFLNVDSAVNSFEYLTVKNKWDILLDKLKYSSLRLEKSGIRMGLLSSFQNSIKEPFVLILVIFVVMINQLFFGLALTSLIVLVVLLQRSFNAVMGVQLQLQLMGEWVGSHIRILEFGEELEKYARKDVIPCSKSLFPIVFDNVSFRYDRDVVLRRINIVINEYDIVGLKGSSGSGKSTLVKLITGLLRPSEGDVIYGNEKASFFRNGMIRVGFYSQSSRFYPGTILENLTLFENNFDEGHIRGVLEKLSILTLVDSMELGIRTPFTGSAMFSSGQYQRLLLAREFISNPDILICDEPTSALDAKIANSFNQLIEKLKGEVTVIVISHQLQALKGCNKVFNINNFGIE